MDLRYIMTEDKFCSFAFASRLALYMKLTHSLVYSVKDEKAC